MSTAPDGGRPPIQLSLPLLVVEPGPPGGPLTVRLLPRGAPASGLLPPPPVAAPRPVSPPMAALVRERVREIAAPRAGLVGSPAPGVEEVAAPPAGVVPDPPLRELEYVVVDVETTGGSAARGHRVTEVAALRVAWDGTVLEEFATLVNPERPIPPFISALTNISWDMVRNAPPFAEIAAEVWRMIAGRVFVAHNAAFDWRFLSHELERATGERPDERVLCTVRLARKVVPEVASRSLDSLSYFFGLENEARHRAYGDARVTAALLGRMMARLEEREVFSWPVLEELLYRRKARKPRGRRAMPMSMDVSEIPSQ